jgi:hypothetical protein
MPRVRNKLALDSPTPLGTLEERIDEMIEQKTELAENIIGSGEAWLTELSTEQLRDMLTLRRDAVGDEDE